MSVAKAASILRQYGLDPAQPDDTAVRAVLRKTPYEQAELVADAYKRIKAPAGSKVRYNTPPEDDSEMSTVERSAGREVEHATRVTGIPANDINNPISKDSIKAWVNVERRSIKVFPTAMSFEDAVQEYPKTFGYFRRMTPEEAKIALEEKGWAACAVGCSKGKAEAMVFAHDPGIARLAARALMIYTRRQGSWTGLTVMSKGGGKLHFDGMGEIIDYLSD